MSETQSEPCDEMRELLIDLRAASADARALAARYAELLVTAVDAYCVEFDARAQTILNRLGEPH